MSKTSSTSSSSSTSSKTTNSTGNSPFGSITLNIGADGSVRQQANGGFESNSARENLGISANASDRDLQNAYSYQAGTSRFGAQLGNEIQDRAFQRSELGKNNDLARSLSLSRASSPSVFQTDNTKRDIFGRNIGDIQNVLDQQNFFMQQRSMEMAQADRNRYNQSLFNSEQFGRDSQLQGRELQNARDIANIQASAQLGAAALGAQGNILSSLFGSINSGSPSYKFWNS